MSALAALTGIPRPEVESLLGELVRQGVVEARLPSLAPELPGEPEPIAEPAPEPEPEPREGEEEPDASGTHRKLFETRLHSLTADERSSLARGAVEPELSALCFDPLPEVVKSLMENPNTGLMQARLIAAHHSNPAGLEALAGRAAFFQDRQVQRLLLRNVLTPVHLLRRALGTRRLLELYKAGQSREMPDKNKRIARELMRTRFTSAASEEKVELIFATEGRSLSALSGLALDGKTTAMLCARPYSSVQLIQNIAHWAAAPPPLVGHLLRQPLVRRMPQLRNLLLRHPNRPSGVS